jgi:hypothetical protein
MSTLNIEEGSGESFVWDENHFEALLKERQEADTPAEPAAANEGSNETPADQKPDPWGDMRYPDADDAHGWYRGKPLKEVDEGIRRLEGATSEANHRAKLAEAKALAAETAANMLQERLRKLTEELGPQVQKPEEPAPKEVDAFTEAGITDLDAEWVLSPTKVKTLLEKEILTKAEKRALELTQSTIKQWEEKQLKQREQQELESYQRDMEIQAKKAAAEALTEAKVPQEYWERTLDYMVPALTSQTGPYLQLGGILEKKNYLDLLEKDPILRAGIQKLSEGAPADTPKNVPGVKAPAAPAAPPAASAAASLSREVRDIAIAQARIAGITDGPDLEQFIEEVGTKIQAARRRRK